MKAVYLAARFSRKKEMKKLSLRIKKLGIKVTSRWLDEEPLPEGKIKRKRFLENTAAMDANDVFAADTLIRFSDDLSDPMVPSSWCTGSRLEECGMAHAWGKKIIVVGRKQSLFDKFPQRVHLKNSKALLRYIKGEIA